MVRVAKHEGNGSRQPESADPESRATWRSLFQFTSSAHAVCLCFAVALAIISGIVVPALAFLLGRTFNTFADFGAGRIDGQILRQRVSYYCKVLAGLGSVSWVLNGIYFMLWVCFGELQARSARERIFASLNAKNVEWYDKESNGTGSLLPRIKRLIRDLQTATSQPLGFIVQYTSTVISALALAFYYSWKLTLVTLSTLPVAGIFLSFISKRMQPSIATQTSQLATASKIANGSLSSIDTVKYFNGQDIEVSRYGISIKAAAKSYITQARINALQIGFVRMFTLGMFIQGFWYGSTLVSSGQKTAGDILTTFWACLMATQAFEQILPHVIVVDKGKAAGALLFSTISSHGAEGDANFPVGKKELPRCVGDIDIRNVSFSYPSRPERLILRSASLFFPAGELTFVVGQSGSGKSTLGALLMRFYAPQQGNILIDGHSLQTLNTEWVRRNITFVQQETVLFNESLSQNIALASHGCRDPAAHEIQDAADFALLRTTISELPDGVNTLIGIGGSTLSGGQRQRVAVARSKLRNTPVLILDEATSALDYTTRTLLMDAIREWRRDRTTIIITHHVDQIFEKDYVYLIETGKVIQEGYRRDLESSDPSPFASFAAARDDPETYSIKDGAQGELDILTEQYKPTQSPLQFEAWDTQNRKRPPSKIPAASADSYNDQIQARRQSSVLVSPFLSALPHAEVWRSSFHSLADPVPRPRDFGGGPRNISKGMSDHDIELLETRALASTQARLRNSRIVPSDSQNPETTFSETRPRPDVSANTLEEERISLKEIFSTIWPVLDRKARALFILGFGFAALHAAGTPLFSWVFSKLLGSLYVQYHQHQVALTWSLSVLAVALGDSASSSAMHFLLEYCGQCWIDALRLEAFRRIMDQPRTFFDAQENGAAAILECLDRNAEEMRNLIGRFAGLFFVAALMMVVAIIWSILISWKLTLVGLAIAPFAYAVTRTFEYVSGKWEKRSNDASTSWGVVLDDAFTSITTVRALTLESYFHDWHIDAASTCWRIGLKRAIYAGIFFGLSDSTVIFVTALLFFYGSILVATSQYTTQHIVSVFSILLFSVSNANAIVSFIPQISASRDTAARVLRLARLPRTSHETLGYVRLIEPTPITFSNLSFSYPSRPNSLALDHLNLTIPRDTCTAIVGLSGSGKSTISSLLLALYPTPPPSSHLPLPNPHYNRPSLTISGHDIRALHIPTLRSLTAIVPQSPTLFPMTIADNITYGLPATSVFRHHSHIHAAARTACIHDFITSLPHGYDTCIGGSSSPSGPGAGGVGGGGGSGGGVGGGGGGGGSGGGGGGGGGLSGGQAQRVAIARALIRRPKLLVLDEATSALDTLTRDKVIHGIIQTSVQYGITVVLITHDAEVMKVANRIVMVHEGTVVEEGSWGELMRKRGRFAGLMTAGMWDGRLE